MQSGNAAMFDQRDRLTLQIVITQHQFADFIGHFDQLLVALLHGHVAVIDHTAQQNLDVDLMIRAINTGRVINGISVQPDSGHRGLDAAKLGRSQIRTLTDNTRPQILTIDAERVIRPVPGICMALVGGFDVGANTAEPQQVDVRFQHRPDQVVRSQFRLRDIKQLADFRGQLDRLRRPLENSAAFGNQLAVVIRPA